MALLHPVLKRVGLQFAAALDQREPEERGADVRLQAVLLEEHPLHRFGAENLVVRHQRRAVRQIPEDRIRLGEEAVRRDLEQRHLSARIHREEFRRLALAL
jgi:hypothetical protein